MFINKHIHIVRDQQEVRAYSQAPNKPNSSENHFNKSPQINMNFLKAHGSSFYHLFHTVQLTILYLVKGRHGE